MNPTPSAVAETPAAPPPTTGASPSSPPATTALGAPETPPATPPAAPEATTSTAPADAPADTPPASKDAPPALDVAALKLPEGVSIADETVKEYGALAGKLGLDAAKAQELFNFYGAAVKREAEAASSYLAQQRAAWTAEVKGDKDIGGAALDANLVHARRAVQKFGGPAFAELLNQTGFGDHPSFVRAFVAIGRALREDSVAGSPASPTPHNDGVPYDVLYPTMTSKE